MYWLMEKYNIKLEHSSRYCPQVNGLAEAFNKTIYKIIKNMVFQHEKDWHESLPKALWAYRITFRTPTQVTPYSLMFGEKVILLVEV